MAGIDQLLQRRSFLVLCPTCEKLTLGIGSEQESFDFPQVVAYRRTTPTRNVPSNSCTSNDASRREAAFHHILRMLGIAETTSFAKVTGIKRNETQNMELEPKSILTGDEVDRLTSLEEYIVVYPCQPGGLDATRSTSQLRNDLSHIWTAAIASKLQLSSSKIAEHGAALIVPDNYRLGDVEIMMDVLFRDIGFKEAVVHCDSTATAFGQGISGGCIVHFDGPSIRISCVEDGVLIAKSMKALPYGGEHIAKSLHWMLHSSFSSSFRPEIRPKDRCALIRFRDDVCFLPGEGPESLLESQIRSLEEVVVKTYLNKNVEEIRKLKVSCEACVAPMGLFNPDLFLPHSPFLLSLRLQSSDAFYSQLVSDNTAQSVSQEFDVLHDVGLDSAIVQSISASTDVDQRRRLYTHIVLTGPCSHLSGLSDMVERRVLLALPSDEVIDTVAVLEPKVPSRHLVWKGGQILGVLSDPWFQREEWMDGVNPYKPNKFGKREIPKSKVFWTLKTELGLV